MYTQEQKIEALKGLRKSNPYNTYGIDENGNILCGYENGAVGIVPDKTISLYIK